MLRTTLATIIRVTALAFIRAYQIFISPLMGHHCRFSPSCSAYALDAIERHGVCLGLYLSCKRLLRCHPACPGGFDPVPHKYDAR